MASREVIISFRNREFHDCQTEFGEIRDRDHNYKSSEFVSFIMTITKVCS